MQMDPVVGNLDTIIWYKGFIFCYESNDDIFDSQFNFTSSFQFPILHYQNVNVTFNHNICKLPIWFWLQLKLKYQHSLPFVVNIVEDYFSYSMQYEYLLNSIRYQMNFVVFQKR